MSDEMKLSERVRRGDFAEWRGNDIYGYPVYGINPFRVADEIAALEKRLAEAEAELSRKDECIVDGLMQRKDLQSRLELAEREADTKLIAALAHRGCCGTEHNPDQGKLHGYCVVCGVPWPCDIAKAFIDAAMQESRNE